MFSIIRRSIPIFAKIICRYFGKRKKDRQVNKDYNKNVLKDKKYNQNTTGRGMPVSYRDTYEKDRDDVIQSKIRQGNASIKDLGKKKRRILNNFKRNLHTSVSLLKK